MKIVVPLSTVVLCFAVLTNCKSTSGLKQITDESMPTGHVSFMPPKGDPSTVRDWRRYGPGAIIRSKEQSQYTNAAEVIGEEAVAEQATATNWTPVSMESGSSAEKAMFQASAGYTFDKLVSAGFKAEALKDLTFAYEFGKTYEMQIPEGSFFKTLRKNQAVINDDPMLPGMLKRGEAHVIQGVLVMESLKVTATDSRNKKFDFSVELTPEQQAKLGSEKTSVKQKTLEFAEPRIAAYLPLLPSALKAQKVLR